MGISRFGGAVVRAVLGTVLLAGCGTVPAPVAGPSAIPSPSPSSTLPRSALRIVGLGDSVTSGEHCACDDYVTGFGHLLQARDGVRVRVTDDGESGSTSDGLARELGSDKDLRTDVGRADVVVVTMGANDLAPALTAWRNGSCPTRCSDPEIATMRVDLGRVLDTVQGLDPGRPGGDHLRVLVTTYWNVFTDGRVADKAERPGYLAWSDDVTRRANAAIMQVAATHGATLVDLYAPFKGGGGADPTDLLAPDGDHPDAAGTALISRTVLAAYEAGR